MMSSWIHADCGVMPRVVSHGRLDAKGSIRSRAVQEKRPHEAGVLSLAERESVKGRANIGFPANPSAIPRLFRLTT